MSTTILNRDLGEDPCECSDCDWTGPASNLHSVSDIEERVSAGEIVPAGECPECGALAHLSEDDNTRERAEIVDALKALREAVYPFEDDDALNAAKAKADAVLSRYVPR